MHLHRLLNVDERARMIGRGWQPGWAGLGWLAVGLIVMVLTLNACRRGVQAIATAPTQGQSDATISGTVRGPEYVTDVDGRVVDVINVETGERQRASTNSTGGFSIKLQPGRYRLELPLHAGETMVRQPGVITLNRRGADAHADFMLGNVRVSRPRGPAYRIADGLGSPIA
jgi:hypothetical protein